MIDKFQEIKNQYHQAERKFNATIKEVSLATDEIKTNNEKRQQDIENVNIIITDIDRQFSEKTGITNLKDMAFLWGAVALQCVRWILIPNIDEESLTPNTENRKESASEGKKDKTGTKAQMEQDKEQSGRDKYPDKHRIIILPVPYDAMKGTEDIVIPGVTEYGKEINGRNHHAATLGHDPIVGQIVGTANIITRTVTFHDALLTTRKVDIPSGRMQVVLKEPYSIASMMEDLTQSVMEDPIRIGSALLKENLHLQSDKHTKQGLPIPFLSADMQQYLLKNKWNSAELENIIKKAGKGILLNYTLAAIINDIVGTLHGFCYDENEDENRTLYSVRTGKIVATSNVISESINIAAIAAGTVGGILTENTDMVKKSVSHLDIGGIIEAIRQVCLNRKIQEAIRREFLEKELCNQFTGTQYTFLEESRYE